jgi:hypothetical protein
LALAECAVLAGDTRTALSNAQEAGQRFAAAGQHESQWRALSIAAWANEKAGDKALAQEMARQASGILADFEKKWGSENYKTYIERPDVKESLRRLQLDSSLQ